MAQENDNGLPVEQAGWSPCPPDELIQLSQQLRATQARRQFLRGTAVTGVFALLTGGTILLLSSEEEPPVVARLSCPEVLQLAKGFHQRCEEEKKSVFAHLSECRRCSAAYRKLGLIS